MFEVFRCETTASPVERKARVTVKTHESPLFTKWRWARRMRSLAAAALTDKFQGCFLFSKTEKNCEEEIKELREGSRFPTVTGLRSTFLREAEGRKPSRRGCWGRLASVRLQSDRFTQRLVGLTIILTFSVIYSLFYWLNVYRHNFPEALKLCFYWTNCPITCIIICNKIF